MITIDLIIENESWGTEKALLATATKASGATFNILGFTDLATELSLLFTDDANIQVINAEWRNKNEPTNVLSFPAFPVKAGDKPKPLLGDIVFAYETVARESSQESKPINHHLAHLVVHGLLHLVGYDHETEEEAEIMEELERAILKSLAIPDPYIVFFNKNLDEEI